MKKIKWTNEENLKAEKKLLKIKIKPNFKLLMIKGKKIKRRLKSVLKKKRISPNLILSERLYTLPRHSKCCVRKRLFYSEHLYLIFSEYFCVGRQVFPGGRLCKYSS